MLDNAGITDTTTQLEINVILNAFCLVVALAGTFSVDKWGRKPTALSCTAASMIFLFIIGALTKVYGSSTNTSGVYGTVAAIFLFQGSYSFGWTPLLYLYPPEVLNYPIRANGQGACQFWNNAIAYVVIHFLAAQGRLFYVNANLHSQDSHRLHHANRPRQHWLEDVYDQRLLGCVDDCGNMVLLG